MGPATFCPQLFSRLFPRSARFALLVLVLMGMASSGWAAPLVVTSPVDDTTTAGTLRAQITAAKPGDTISFDPSVTSITLSAGELVISRTLTITGPGAANLTISANNAGRVFHITGGRVSIAGLTLTAGAAGNANTAANGGGILVDSGSLNLSNCTVSACNAASAITSGGVGGGGGGLSVATLGTATVSGCKFSGNTATNADNTAQGGGILNAGTLTVNGTTFSGNTAGVGGGLLNGGTLTLTGSTFSANTAIYSGGGLAEATKSADTISGSTFSANTAGQTGGGISASGLAAKAGLTTISNCVLTANTAGGGAGTNSITLSGGGLAVLANGNISLQTSTVTSNSVSPNAANGNLVSGGGVSVGAGGTLAINQCTLSGNGAMEGGGLSAIGTPFRPAQLTLTASTVSGNTASGDTASGNGGGGLFVGNVGIAALTNDTLYSNTATNGNGGGADNVGTLTFTSSTVSANTVDNGSGGGVTNSGASAASATLQAVIVAGNQNLAGTGPDITGAFTSAGSNLLGDGTGATGFTAAHDQVGTTNAPIDPLLGTLQDNGGPTFTQALGPGSPAINGDYSVHAPGTDDTDQRGGQRPLGPRDDIGAYEAPSPPVAPTNLVATPGFMRVLLTWTGSTDAVSYNVYRSRTPGGEDLTSPLNVDANGQVKPILGTRYTDLGLTDGTTYYYVVRAVNATGLSDPSTEASATPLDNRLRGSVLAWGDNQSGELGNGTFTRSLYAVPVSAPVVAGNTVTLNNVVQVSGGSNYSLALTADGYVYAWGDNTYGQLGSGQNTFGTSSSNSDVPARVQSEFGGDLTGIVAISAGQDHALALGADGTVYAWGRNQYGQLGNGAADGASSTDSHPSAVAVRSSQSGNFNFGTLSGVVAIAAGGYHSLAVLSDGTALAWGYNSSGQLGDADSGPGADSSTPVAVSGLTNAVAVEAGQYFSLALDANGNVSAWGYNNDGELGQGNSNANANETVPVPVQLTDPTTGLALTVTQIAAGDAHALALTSSGSVYAWGSDDADQLGDNGAGNGFGFGSAFSPTPSPVGTITALTTIPTPLGAGSSFSLAVQTDHTLLAWGANGSGQLGTGAVASSQQPAPVLTAPATSLLYIYAATGGTLHSLAIQNLPPVAARASYTVGVNTTRDVPAPGLNANATDAENDGPFTASLVRQAAHGVVTVYPNGRFTYTPTTGYQGADSFTYKVNDGRADSAPSTVTLTVVPEALKSITVTPLTVSRPEGVTQQFIATGNYNDGNTNDLTHQVIWASSNTAVATISNAPATPGLAATAARNVGVTTITATQNSLSGTATLTVTRTISAIRIAPLNKSLAKGLTQAYTATATYTDGFTQDITAGVRFSTSDSTVAAFSAVSGSQNILTALKVGPVTVTATDPVSALTASTPLTVTVAAETGITVTPANSTLVRGLTRQYTATANYTDGSLINVTQTVLWSTVNPNVATIDDNGVAAGIGVGQTTVTATNPIIVGDPASGLSGSTSVTVNDPNLVPHSHLLYNLAGGAVSLWDVDTAGRVVEHLYGPYAGYRATAVATGTDGITHILWNKTDGTVALWAVLPNGSFTTRTYGPYTDAPKNTLWVATAISIGPDNVPHLLWNNPDGKVKFWNVNPQTGAFTVANYGPFPGYVATALATGTDGISHILWNNTTSGEVSLWAVDTAGTITRVEYGPFSGYSATALSVGTDGAIHILWNKVNGVVSFWNIDSKGGLTHTEYGPFPGGWKAVACSTGPDNVSHILWGRPDQTVAFWDVDSVNGSFNYHLYGPLSGYTPTALSSGP